jgi:hypothetical protein
MPANVLIATLAHVWRTLEPLQHPMALMGGMAVAAWGYLRATRDVDLLLKIESADLERLLDRLRAAGLRPKQQPPVLALGPLRLLQLLYTPPGEFVDVQIDLLLAESAYHREALARRVAIEVPGVEGALSILSCEDLILHKLLAGRILDRADVAALLRQNRAALDLAYLLRWTHQLALTLELSEAWEQAFPGVPLPSGDPA